MRAVTIAVFLALSGALANAGIVTSLLSDSDAGSEGAIANGQGQDSAAVTAFHNALTELLAEFSGVEKIQQKITPTDDLVSLDEEAEMEAAIKEATEGIETPEKEPAKLSLPGDAHLADATQALTAGTVKAAGKAKESKQVAVKEHLRKKEAIKQGLEKAKSSAEVVLKNGQKMTHDEFQAAITNLFKLQTMGLSAEEFAATPFGGSVEKIRTLIVDDMMPKVIAAHHSDQHELDALNSELEECHHAKGIQFDVAKPVDKEYREWAPKHITCRQTEAGLNQDKIACWQDEKDKQQVANLKCKEFALLEANLGNQNSNKVIVTKGGSEAAKTYITRISTTICGEAHTSGEGGFGENGFLDLYIHAERECRRVTLEHADQKTKCQGNDLGHMNKQKECDNLQDQMDLASCEYAIDIKDACEEYEECYASRREAFETANATVTINEHDRKAEWKGLKRMACLVSAFTDGKVENEEITRCREMDVHVSPLLDIAYPDVKDDEDCTVPKEYPSTSEYKTAQFASLPELAKGKVDANECTGVAEISTEPASGSPEECKCERITLNGPYSPGPLVKCVNCLDIRRTQDKSSCPDGTKLFSPRSRQDWKSFLVSTDPLRAPDFVIDITRDDNTCGGCEHQAMNSNNGEQKGWVTSDGSPWWLRSTTGAREPNGDYHANCFLSLRVFDNEDEVAFNDKKCDYHSKSYFCQLIQVSATPKEGSPLGCACEKVDLTGHWSPQTLMKCIGCLEVSKSTQKNSCPMGTKLFAPATREDWKTFLESATVLRSPNFIIDITRPQNGCGGCTSAMMNSDVPEQATWKTSDGAPWWLRSTTYFQPQADYKANCYMDIWGGKTENAINFGTKGCDISANAYYCQLAKKR